MLLIIKLATKFVRCNIFCYNMHRAEEKTPYNPSVTVTRSGAQEARETATHPSNLVRISDRE
jgi:hypothetical protein